MAFALAILVTEKVQQSVAKMHFFPPSAIASAPPVNLAEHLDCVPSRTSRLAWLAPPPLLRPAVPSRSYAKSGLQVHKAGPLLVRRFSHVDPEGHEPWLNPNYSRKVRYSSMGPVGCLPDDMYSDATDWSDAVSDAEWDHIMTEYHDQVLSAFDLYSILERSLSNEKPVQPYLDNWHCLGFVDSFDWRKPVSIQFGDIPLVAWKNGTRILVCPDVCKHLGSTLRDSEINSDGCLVCPYHGVEHGLEHAIGKVMVLQEKLYWTPNERVGVLPPSTPNFDVKGYTHTHIVVDMDASLIDSAINTMVSLSSTMTAPAPLCSETLV